MVDDCVNLIALAIIGKVIMAEMRKRPDLDSILLYHVHRLDRLLRFHMQRKIEADQIDIGITQEQMFLLYRLYVKDGQSQRELADKKLNDYPNITRMIDKLEKKGLVVRESDENDRRVCIVRLTKRGRDFFDVKQPVMNAEVEKLSYGISPEEEKIVRKVFAQLEKNLT